MSRRRTVGCLVAVAALFVAVFAIAVWRRVPMFPGSRGYRPISPREQTAFASSRADVFPNQVRSSPDAYRTASVRWAGVLEDFTVDDENGRVVVRMDLAHRYFDWIEDFGTQRARYFVSPRGEGHFRAAWPMPASSRDEIRSNIHRGDLMIVYGVPSEVRGDVIGMFPTTYVRLLPRWIWLDDVLDYGRPGEPSRTLRTVLR